MPDKEADNRTTFTISADGIDVQKIMEKIRERVEKKRAAGVYDKYNLDKVTRLEVAEAKRLTQYASRTRYPSSGEPVSGEECDAAIRSAEATLDWASEIIERGAVAPDESQP